jgi:hypothetical protein
MLMMIVRGSSSDQSSALVPAVESTDNNSKPPRTSVLVVSEAGKWGTYAQRRFNTIFRDRTTSQWQFPKAYTDGNLRYLAIPRIDGETAPFMIPDILTAFEATYEGAVARQKQAVFRSFSTNDWNGNPAASKVD